MQEFEKKKMVKIHTGHKYEGYWIKGKDIMEAFGKLITPDGDLYEGAMHKNHPYKMFL